MNTSLRIRAYSVFVVLVALLLNFNLASAQTLIISDTFMGTGALNGTAPTVDNYSSDTWTAPTMTNGNEYLLTSTGLEAGLNNAQQGTAYLPFTITSGNIYNLSVQISNLTGATYGGFGFTAGTPGSVNDSPSTTSPAQNTVAWALATVPSRSNTVDLEAGPEQTTLAATQTNAFTTTPITADIVLNTTGSQWTLSLLLNGSQIGSTFTYTTNPAITDIFVGNSASNPTFSDLTLTETAVPEPSTWALIIGGLAMSVFLPLRRRQA
jgi:hypothetical protein